MFLRFRDKHKVVVFENKVLGNIFGPKKEKVKQTEENYIRRIFMICIPQQKLTS